jgi:hypothetical protein
VSGGLILSGDLPSPAPSREGGPFLIDGMSEASKAPLSLCHKYLLNALMCPALREVPETQQNPSGQGHCLPCDRNEQGTEKVNTRIERACCAVLGWSQASWRPFSSPPRPLVEPLVIQPWLPYYSISYLSTDCEVCSAQPRPLCTRACMGVTLAADFWGPGS